MQLRIKHWYIHVCNVVDYGAKGDGLYDSTKAIQFAIGVCAHRATAKRRAAVYVPAGVAAFRDNDNGSGNDDAEGDVIVVRSLQGRTHSVDESVFENDDSDSSNGESARRADGHENVSLGVFRSGPLWLASNVDFIIDGKLVAIADLSMYPRNLRRTRGTNKLGYVGLLNGGLCDTTAFGDSLECKSWTRVENVAVYGEGSIEAESGFRVWRTPPTEDAPALIAPQMVQNFIIRSLTIRRAPAWAIHVALSKLVFIEDVTIELGGLGVLIDSTYHVNVVRMTSLDAKNCIVIESGIWSSEARPPIHVPTGLVKVADLRCRATQLCVSIGPGISGNVHNVTVINSELVGCRTGVTVHSREQSGGKVYHIKIDRVRMSQVQRIFDVNTHVEFSWQKWKGSGAASTFTHITLQHILAVDAHDAGRVLCTSQAVCSTLTLADIVASSSPNTKPHPLTPIQCEHAIVFIHDLKIPYTNPVYLRQLRCL